MKSEKKQLLLLIINAMFLEPFEFEATKKNSPQAGVAAIRIAAPWFLSCTTRCKFTSLVPLLYLSWTTLVQLLYLPCTTFVPLFVPLFYLACITRCTTFVPLLYHSCTSTVPRLYHSCTTRCNRSIIVNRAPLTVLSCVPTMILCQE